jgi:hypothetical protein
MVIVDAPTFVTNKLVGGCIPTVAVCTDDELQVPTLENIFILLK